MTQLRAPDSENPDAPSIRPAAVAGMFYPKEPTALAAMLDRMLAEAPAPTGPAPKAIIAPHAGYVYSGALAAAAYKRLQPAAGEIERIVLLGPCHRVSVEGLATSSARAWETPLGPVPLARAQLDAVAALPQVTVSDPAHAQEHSLEVHLPFLQRLLPKGFTLAPFAVGRADAAAVAAVLEALWGGPETRIVISSDLSHYLDYETARDLDGRTAAAIEALDWRSIGREQACGRVPVSGLLDLARRRGMGIERVGLCSSGDTKGPKDRVVGYGAWALSDGAATPTETKTMAEIGRTQGVRLLNIVDAVIDRTLETGKAPAVDVASFAPELRAPGATFVTVEKGGRLRGCIGSLEAHRPLIEDLVKNAHAAAFKDPRFPPVTKAERGALSCSISLLSPAAEITGLEKEADLIAALRPGRDGLIIQDGRRRATFLPQVWEQIPEPAQFLAQLKRKAGLAPDHWSPTMKAWRYSVTKIARRAAPEGGAS
ncbi:AmmeMemoRadiSam system protein B [Marivibrio halodurans]|uniref:MEMO1 family protein KAJ83_07080 n=1 Tax=Marivibrio halodurans TaxID=2039722 RepID=A0A8J7RYL4_9PROT|nr:AmmeMemoRadiSam system protein B [Marivibrio halodurans]MBP5856765.1 AmmeMemoRadiSam system protein B [Marivibrio halodurans]